MIFGETSGTSGLPLLTSITALISMTCLYLLPVLFLIWVHGVYKNLYAFPDVSPSTTPGWAVGYFFVPIVGLYKPYQLLDEVWQSSDPNESCTRQKSGASPLIIACWIVFLIRLLVNGENAYHQINPDSDGDLYRAIFQAGRLTVSQVVLVVTLIFMNLVIRAINNRQEAKEKALVEAWNNRHRIEPELE